MTEYELVDTFYSIAALSDLQSHTWTGTLHGLT